MDLEVLGNQENCYLNHFNFRIVKGQFWVSRRTRLSSCSLLSRTLDYWLPLTENTFAPLFTTLHVVWALLSLIATRRAPLKRAHSAAGLFRCMEMRWLEHTLGRLLALTCIPDLQSVLSIFPTCLLLSCPIIFGLVQPHHLTSDPRHLPWLVCCLCAFEKTPSLLCSPLFACSISLPPVWIIYYA